MIDAVSARLVVDTSAYWAMRVVTCPVTRNVMDDATDSAAYILTRWAACAAAGLATSQRDYLAHWVFE